MLNIKYNDKQILEVTPTPWRGARETRDIKSQKQLRRSQRSRAVGPRWARRSAAVSESAASNAPDAGRSAIDSSHAAFASLAGLSIFVIGPLNPSLALNLPARLGPGQRTHQLEKHTQTDIYDDSCSQASSCFVPYATGNKSGVPSDPTVSLEVKQAAISLAQLTVANQGEYLGTGSLVWALHRLDDSVPQSPIDKPPGLPFFPSAQYFSTISDTFTSSMESLISDFPDKLHCDALITSYFEHENWCIGVPQKLVLRVYDQMWVTIQADRTSLNRINFHWVTLLFVMFALSSACATEDESRKYFLQALTARRRGEDMLCTSFTSTQPAMCSEGAAYACLAAALLGKYMIDRGQMTEAWKLVSSALRNAQNAGLHRNPTPKSWREMTEDEQILRCLSWHLCAVTDRFLSLVLGRPVVSHARDCDISLPRVSTDLALDGSSNTAFSEFLSVHPDPSDGKADFDARMAEWEASVPSYLSFSQLPDTSFDYVYPKLGLLRLMLHGFSETCPLLRSQRTLLLKMWWTRQICFSVNLPIFEAAVMLSIVLLRAPGHPCAQDWWTEREAAIELFESIKGRDFGDIGPQAIKILRILQASTPKQQTSIHSKPGKAVAEKDSENEDVQLHLPTQAKSDAEFVSQLTESANGVPDPSMKLSASTAPIPTQPHVHASAAGCLWPELELFMTMPTNPVEALSGLGWGSDHGGMEEVWGMKTMDSFREMADMGNLGETSGFTG
ncbi:hypothetical protein DFH11DRAFT_1739996 [Phellopilus nigrolimitatus]|nr:hypothetical protein DFH11DRAFT_1739996 [Phellopilus nigrolimitatus]